MHIFRHIFLSNYWWQKSDIWSQASYRYPISWDAFLDPSDSYFLLADLLIFIYIEHICTFFVAFFSATIDGRNLIFCQNLHIGTQYCGKCFIPPLHWRGYTVWPLSVLPSVLPSVCPSVRPKTLFVAFVSATIDGKNLIVGHKLHICTTYRGKRYLTSQIPTFCLPT